MVVRGRVSGGVVVLDDANALPEGALVRVEPVEADESREQGGSLSEKLLRLAGTVKGLPSDLARNHDHYLHGLPKK
jgi:hypothetical protein